MAALLSSSQLLYSPSKFTLILVLGERSAPAGAHRVNPTGTGARRRAAPAGARVGYVSGGRRELGCSVAYYIACYNAI